MRGSIERSLRQIEADREEIERIEREELELVLKYDMRARKKNYSQRFSDLLARRIADDLRPSFPGIVPDASGKQLESKAGGANEAIKVDVRLHTDYGMALGISIKTMNFVDRETKRYTKNMQRVDKEFRSEASSLHAFQPQAVLIGLFLLPDDSRVDGAGRKSSFQRALEIFRIRAGRREPRDDHALFERLLIGTYSRSSEDFGLVRLHDAGGYSVGGEMPEELDWSDFLEIVCEEYERRTRRAVKRPGR